MIFDYMVYGLVALLSALVSFYLTNNLYFLIGTFSVYAIYFITYEMMFKRKMRVTSNHKKDLTTFIHDFFLSYSVDFVLDNAINAAQINVTSALKEQIKMLDEFKGMDKLERLNEYFSSWLYQLFLKTISLCECNSLDRDHTIAFLLEENNRYIFNQKIVKRNILRSFVEFSLLWIISFLIMIIVRSAINNYFDKVAHVWFYLLGIGIYFAFFLFSIHLFLQSTHRGIKRYEQ